MNARPKAFVFVLFLLFCVVGGGYLWLRARSAPSFTVGSKAFPEGIILGDVLVTMLEREGISTAHRSGLGGTRLVWAALLKGDIDAYAEYTGTLTHELLADQKITNLPELNRVLADRGLGMSPPLGFSNTYGLAVQRSTAQRLHLRTLSDLAAHPELRVGVNHEFLTRNEGWPAVQTTYGLHPARVVSLEHELLYRALKANEVDVINVYTTDADIFTDGLSVLEDDRRLFPRYDAVYVYRLASLQRAPVVTDLFGRLAGTLDELGMIALNAQVKTIKRPEAEVARTFVARRFGAVSRFRTLKNTSSGFVPARVWSDTYNHLQLVVVALIVQVLVGVPLGIVAFRHPRVGQLILGICGVFQTIPSLALLVFLVPVLGIGYKPALVALCIYGLLPVVRNTYTGLKEISPQLQESALALGLPARERLLQIELPLASRTILAGIKTSAVVNVGTATLGAIVGAGGFGEPIMIGIRRDDMYLLLQGSVPAASLALLVQAGFEWLERRVVPAGLKRPAAVDEVA